MFEVKIFFVSMILLEDISLIITTPITNSKKIFLPRTDAMMSK